MDINTITHDRPAGSQASNAPRGGDGSFQVAYARVVGENYAPAAREGVPAHSLRGQDSPPPPDRAAHTVRAGETLSGIARARLSTIGVETNAKAAMQGAKQLALANNIRNLDRIYVGQKLDLTALESSFGHSKTAPPPGGIDRSASARIEQPQQWHWEDPMPEAGAQLAAEETTALPLTIAALPSPMPPIAPDDAATDTPLAARQVALYEQTASIAPEKPVESVRALPDIVYKGLVGKVLDALPLEPSTRTALQRTNAIVSGALTIRSLGALAGLGGPVLAVAGLLWGVFSSRQIDAAATGETKPVGDPEPAFEATRTARNE